MSCIDLTTNNICPPQRLHGWIPSCLNAAANCPYSDFNMSRSQDIRCIHMKVNVLFLLKLTRKILAHKIILFYTPQHVSTQ